MISRTMTFRFANANQFVERIKPATKNPRGGGVLPYVTLTGTCGPMGYGFLGCFVLNGVSISTLSVLNRVSLYDLMA